MTRRYDTGSQGEYQPGSNDTVLLNQLGITSSAEMDDVELDLLLKLYDKVLSEVKANQSITVADIKEWHHSWLGNIYEWAGKERSVNMSKGDFHFAAAEQIPGLLKSLDTDYLDIYTPCEGLSETELVKAISKVHVEFILAHPFREGNGRLSRLLANIMALQAGWPELDFSLWDDNKEFYFAAINAGGIAGDMSHLEKLVKDTLELTFKA